MTRHGSSSAFWLYASKPPANRNSPRSSEDLSDEIDAIRTEIQNLTSTVTKVAGSQINHAQESVESAIKGNPFAAVAIAAAAGFLYGAIRR
jgi:ElaB/YqjD/DUF883 family membrane-anchored ribosome-binding protein